MTRKALVWLCMSCMVVFALGCSIEDTTIGTVASADTGLDAGDTDIAPVDLCEGVICDDGNPCTADTCDPRTGCVSTPVAQACEDGNPCTLNDTCVEGQCQNGPKKECDDEDVCTDEFCDLITGLCEFSYNEKPCDDGSPCTGDDLCSKGVCEGLLDDCDDGNVCTGDGCDPETGCTFAAVTKSCDDGDACTSGDMCAEKSCSGEAITCDDGNVCTSDACDSNAGCVFEGSNSSGLSPCLNAWDMPKVAEILT